MFRFGLKIIALSLAALFSTLAFAMEPLYAISPNDRDYRFYAGVANVDQKLVNDGWVETYSEFNQWNVQGRVVPLRDGSPSNPFNLVVSVNGNIYYVDAVLSSVDSYKIRRRWRNNPEPGVFLRIEGLRLNPEDGSKESVQLWIKIATPEGRALPVLKLLEGNYDLADAGGNGTWPEPTQPKAVPVLWDGYTPGQPNPGPLLPPPPFMAAPLATDDGPGGTRPL